MIGSIFFLLSALCMLLPPEIWFYAAGYQAAYTGLDAFEHSYQLLTYTLCHGNLSHLAFNMLLLVPSCWYLEREVGWKRTLVLVIASAVISALLWDWAYRLSFLGQFDPRPRILIGASGVASATVCVGLLVMAVRHRLLTVICYALLLGIFLSNLSDALATQASPAPVAYWGHIGGYLVGLFMAPFLCQPKSPRRR